MYERKVVDTLVGRLQESRRFIQIVIGPRQTGKSTAVSQALVRLGMPSISFSFDRPKDQRSKKLEEVWEGARRSFNAGECDILFLDEVQKVPDWSSTVKYLWDEGTRRGCDLKVVLAGSLSLLLKRGMAESLKGRFETLRSGQWVFSECRDAFGCTLDEFLYFGGYPGALPLRDYEERWYDYLHSSIIEPTLTQDVLEMEQVRKPALLRALFEVGAAYSAQEVSYRKLLGQLDDRGNTDVVAHYLDLLSNAGMLSGIKKYDTKILKEKSSSPRLLVHDTALMTAACGERRAALLADSERRGHLVETAVGAYLLGRAQEEHFSLNWWREGNREVDFVVTKGRRRTAIEVKSGRVKRSKGLGAFIEQFPGTYALIVGSEEFPIEDFLLGKVALFQ